MNSIVSACLDSLSKINETDYEYEMLACEQLIESYDKLIKLMEHYTPEQIDNIPYLSTLIPSVVFQEAEVINNQNQNNNSDQQPATNQGTDNSSNSNDDNKSDEKSNDGKEQAWKFNPRPDKANGNGKENIIISILAFIPRLIIACVRFIIVSIKNLFSGKKAATDAANNVAATVDEDPEYWKAKLNEFNQEISQKYPSAMLYFDWDSAVQGVKDGGQAATLTTTNAKTGVKKTTISVILPINIEEINNTIQQVVVKHVDVLVNFLTGAFGGMTKEGGPNEIKAENIKQMIDVFNNDNAIFTKKRETANNILKTQKASNALYVDGAVKYSIIEVYANLDVITRTMNALSDRANRIAALIKKLQDDPNKKPITTEAAQNLKDMDAALKTVINTLASIINEYCLKLIGASTESLKAIETFINNNPKDQNANNNQQQTQNLNNQQTPQNGNNPSVNNQTQTPPAENNEGPNKLQQTRDNLNNSKVGQAVNNSAVGRGLEWLQGRRKYKYKITDKNGNPIGFTQSFDGNVKDWKNYVNSVAATGNKIEIVKEYYYDENGNEVILEHDEYYQDDNITPLEY